MYIQILAPVMLSLLVFNRNGFIECHIWVAMCQLIYSSVPVKYKRKGLLLNQICIEQNRARQRGARLVIQQNHFVKPTLSTTKFF